MAGPLGCAQDYTISITGRGGSPTLGQVEPETLVWGRVLDDTSTAEVVVPMGGDVACCELLGRTRSWCHEFVVHRDGVRVWEGPIARIEYGRDSTFIRAKDVSAWLFKRKIRTLIDYTTTGLGAADLATIAQAIVRDALAIDDPQVLPYLLVLASGVTGQRQYAPDSAYAGDELRELARTGIDWTALGRRLIIGPETALARLPTLLDEHFIGELTVIEDGDAAATAATVIGKGVKATSGGEGTCGLLEVLAKEEQILDTASAQAESDAIVAAGSPTPVYVDVPDGARLAPEAPVGINDLIPGVVAPVAVAEVCRPVTTDLRLQRLSVRFDGDGEQVAVTLVPTGIDSTT